MSGGIKMANKLYLDWDNAEVAPEDGSRGRVSEGVPVVGEIERIGWRTQFDDELENRWGKARSAQWGEASLDGNVLRVPRVSDGHEPELRQLLDGCVRRTSEALDRQDEAREKAAAPQLEAAADEQERADRVADGFTQPPETPLRQMPAGPKPSTS
jgi:hypothetical protein